MHSYQSLVIKKTLLALTTIVALASLSYLFLDKPIAFWTYQHHPLPSSLLVAITHIPKMLTIAALFVYIIYIIAWSAGKTTELLNHLLGAANCVAITSFFLEWTKYAFGRYWPKTWINQNPSLINTNDYGFHYFHSKLEAFHSFPSGHTAVTVTVMLYLALSYARIRLPAILLSLIVPLALIGMDYHFLADTIAGAGLGGLVAYLYYKIITGSRLDLT